ncbi:OLC1v1010035C1 [Oldenlandia corymbosa var. corymbosa]|uniref:OLC1v1010035C1 n=1 Tax=Oldenlandia corymbosa var. corymbosa TaxID=529605 RepID=A0AAV1DSS5_OLDCO|nr:OLC1v1010035C1 [Oldenlandia corymbosa var. corymbosa]
MYTDDDDDARGSKGSRRSKIPDKKPHFFKVVFNPVSQGLRIPTSFMEDYADAFKNNKKVVLKIPNGETWPIELRETEIGTWFKKGWKEFASYYEIEPRQFLVFRYEGNYQFYVLIFDSSGSEIEYPVEMDNTEPEKDQTTSKNETKKPSRRSAGRKRKTTGVKEKGVEGKRRKSGNQVKEGVNVVEISKRKSRSSQQRSGKGRKTENVKKEPSEECNTYQKRLRQGVRDLNQQRNLNYSATHVFSL